jgi:hypothetical protein
MISAKVSTEICCCFAFLLNAKNNCELRQQFRAAVYLYWDLTSCLLNTYTCRRHSVNILFVCVLNDFELGLLAFVVVDNTCTNSARVNRVSLIPSSLYLRSTTRQGACTLIFTSCSSFSFVSFSMSSSSSRDLDLIANACNLAYR